MSLEEKKEKLKRAKDGGLSALDLVNGILLNLIRMCLVVSVILGIFWLVAWTVNNDFPQPAASDASYPTMLKAGCTIGLVALACLSVVTFDFFTEEKKILKVFTPV